MPATTPIPRGEDGFTLVELLVAMLVLVVLLLAALKSFDVFVSRAAQQTRQTDANDQVRREMDRAVADLRGASKIMLAGATDLVYAVPETSTTTRVERLCVSSSILYRSSTVSTTPVVPAGACSTGTQLATLSATSGTTFTYDGASSSATPATVTNVGLSFGLDSSGGGRTITSTLKASAARRSSGSLPVTGPDDIRNTCSGANALLSLSATIPNVAGLSVTYATSGGVTLGVGTGTTVSTITLPSATTTIVATITDGLGLTNTITKDVTCSS
jgi:prepilin-type N-terminal cleavage/methylation domain-containing protein